MTKVQKSEVGSSMVDAVQVQSLAGAAAEKVRQAIIGGKLKPGARLIEQKLASQLLIGQPTLREALKELEYQGFVRKVANKGTYVTKLDRDDFRRILEVRMVLEAMAIEKAAASISDDALKELEAAVKQMGTAARKFDRTAFHNADLLFHRTIWKAAGNEYLESALERVTFSLFAFVLLGQERSEFLAAVGQHKEILDGLRSRKPAQAREAFVQSTIRFWDEYYQVGQVMR